MDDNIRHNATQALKNSLYLPSCHSTNTYAAEWLKENDEQEGWIVYTFDQTNGRGQQGSVWESEPYKNLTFSVILKPFFLLPVDQFQLNMVVSLAVLKFLDGLKIKAMIKWPNDIYVNEKKICGILIENQVRGNRILNSIVGIGLNINQHDFKTPNATSVFLQKDMEYNLLESLQYFRDILMSEYQKLCAGNVESIKKEYHAAMFLRNKPSIFKKLDTTFVGSIKGVNNQGRLLVQTESGLMDFGLKEISFQIN